MRISNQIYSGILTTKILTKWKFVPKPNFYKKNAAKDRKRAKYGDRSLKKAFR